MPQKGRPTSGKGSGKARDAGTGQYMSKKYAQQHHKTTIVERDKGRRRGDGKKR